MTAKSAIPAVAVAVYSALNVAAITTTLGCPVYDNVPQAAPFPYIKLGSWTENRLDTMSKAGKDLTLQVHVFSSYAGGAEAQAILAKVSQLLNYPSTTTAPFDLTASGFDCLMCRPEDAHDAGAELVAGVNVQHYVQSVRVWLMER